MQPRPEGDALNGWVHLNGAHTYTVEIAAGHHFFVDQGWNKLRIVATGPRIQTWVNRHAVEDLVNEDVYKTHPSGFIGLQISVSAFKLITNYRVGFGKAEFRVV